MLQPQARSSSNAMGQESDGTGQLTAQVGFTGNKTIPSVVLVQYFQFLPTENVN